MTLKKFLFLNFNSLVTEQGHVTPRLWGRGRKGSKKSSKKGFVLYSIPLINA